MGLLNGLLGKSTPVVKDDQEWPVESAEYYEEQGVQYVMPATVGVNVPYEPTEDKSLPGRGVVDHGVPVEGGGYVVVPATEEVIAEREQTALAVQESSVYEVDQPEPVRVAVVELPLPHTQQKRFNTAQFDLTGTYVAGPPIVRRPLQILGRRANRTCVQLRIDAQTAYIGPDAETLQGGLNGALILPTDGWVTIHSTEPVWIVSGAVAANIVHLLEEYDIDSEVVAE